MTGLQPGTVIGDQRYVTVRALSEHGDAEVWSAQDNVRDQLVTLVVLPLSTPTALAVLDAASAPPGSTIRAWPGCSTSAGISTTAISSKRASMGPSR